MLEPRRRWQGLAGLRRKVLVSRADVAGSISLVRALAVLAATLALAAPAQAALEPGDRATIDVSVATLWKAPNLYRAVDRPSLGNPVDPVAWSRNLVTTADRIWLDSHVQTQALYGDSVVVLAVRG